MYKRQIRNPPEKIAIIVANRISISPGPANPNLKDVKGVKKRPNISIFSPEMLNTPLTGMLGFYSIHSFLLV